MAAAAALNVVRQIQALADGPETPEMRDCLGQVVSSLQYFLEHPDSNVRVLAARTLLKLKRVYPTEMAALDLRLVRDARRRCVDALEAGTAADDAEDLRIVFDQILDAVPSPAVAPPMEAGPPADGAGSRQSGGTDRGEVVIKFPEAVDAKVRGGILEKVVTLHGVMSVTFEGPYVVVNTRTPSIAADTGFLADLLQAVKAQGVVGAQLVTAASAAAGTAVPSACGGREGFVGASEAAPAATSSEQGDADADADADAGSVQEDEPDYIDGDDYGVDGDDDEADVSYLNDSPHAEIGGAPVASVGCSPVLVGGGYRAGPITAGVPTLAQFSFFAQGHWVGTRQIQERDDDPSIAARLAKAKAREAERRQEEQTRLGRLSSWMRGR